MQVVLSRRFYVALAALTIALGLVIHLHGTAFPDALRDILGDALWAAMICWWVGAAAPRARPLARSAVAWAICGAVEASQLVHTAALDAVRETTLGHLVFGSGFDPRDFASYAAGVAIAAAIEWLVIRRIARLVRSGVTPR